MTSSSNCDRRRAGSIVLGCLCGVRLPAVCAGDPSFFALHNIYYGACIKSTTHLFGMSFLSMGGLLPYVCGLRCLKGKPGGPNMRSVYKCG